MLKLFQYNWQIRDDWFKWCANVSEEELLRQRTGGVGGILHTLFHIVDVEWSWIQIIQGKPDLEEPFEKYKSLEKVMKLSSDYHRDVEQFLGSWAEDMDSMPFESPTGKRFTFGEVLRHVIAHEIHHVGQLSVWSRELGLTPISPNFIGRGIH